FVPPWQEITITISRFSIGWDFYLWKESCTSRQLYKLDVFLFILHKAKIHLEMTIGLLSQ
ncbi:hypothetical protein, partial [Nostoc sp.]|uniref:hypothetical protein n=1 Tax=Nostoc sp. TaxID=1180 RepID=UPI002FF8510E